MHFFLKWYFAITYLRKRSLYQHSLLNMDAYLISFNGIFNVFIQNIISFLFLIFLGFSSRRERRWRVNKTECHAYLEGLGFVFYMIELNTHDWIAFPLRFCIFSNTTTLLQLVRCISECQPYLYSDTLCIFCKFN